VTADGGAATVDVFSDLIGQPRAVALLRAATAAPVHAYLLSGPAGSGRKRAALAFAAALLCPEGGCGSCSTCRRASAGIHPDVVVAERVGASMSVAQAREIRRLASRSPNEGSRTVLLLADLHVALDAAPVLLKVIEEPPASTIFVVLADHVPPELATIASRCLRVEFGALQPEDIEAALVERGADAEAARVAAASAGGRMNRAELLVDDPGFAARAAIWRAVPGRLDGSGAAAAVVAAELSDLLASAAVAPLEARHRAELVALAEAAEQGGGRRRAAAAAPKDVVERHRRELRRLRVDELRFGLGVLAGAYRDAALAPFGDRAAAVAAVETIADVTAALVRNPSENLLLQALLVRLPPLSGAPGGTGPADRLPYSTTTPG